MDEIHSNVHIGHGPRQIPAHIAGNDLDRGPPGCRGQLGRSSGQAADIDVAGQKARYEPASYVTRGPGEEDP